MKRLTIISSVLILVGAAVLALAHIPDPEELPEPRRAEGSIAQLSPHYHDGARHKPVDKEA